MELAQLIDPTLGKDAGGKGDDDEEHESTSSEESSPSPSERASGRGRGKSRGKGRGGRQVSTRARSKGRKATESRKDVEPAKPARRRAATPDGSPGPAKKKRKTPVKPAPKRVATEPQPALSGGAETHATASRTLTAGDSAGNLPNRPETTPAASSRLVVAVAPTPTTRPSANPSPASSSRPVVASVAKPPSILERHFHLGELTQAALLAIRAMDGQTGSPRPLFSPEPVVAGPSQALVRRGTAPQNRPAQEETESHRTPRKEGRAQHRRSRSPSPLYDEDGQMDFTEFQDELVVASKSPAVDKGKGKARDRGA